MNEPQLFSRTLPYKTGEKMRQLYNNEGRPSTNNQRRQTRRKWMITSNSVWISKRQPWKQETETTKRNPTFIERIITCGFNDDTKQLCLFSGSFQATLLLNFIHPIIILMDMVNIICFGCGELQRRTQHYIWRQVHQRRLRRQSCPAWTTLTEEEKHVPKISRKRTRSLSNDNPLD